MVFAMVVIFGLFAGFVCVLRSPLFSFIFLTCLFSCFISFVISFSWALSIHYKPALNLGGIISACCVILCYCLILISALVRRIYLNFFGFDGKLAKIVNFILKFRHIFSLILALVLTTLGVILTNDSSKPIILNYEYTGDLTTINIEYYTLIVPVNTVVVAPQRFQINFEGGDIFLCEKPLSPVASEIFETPAFLKKRLPSPVEPVFSGEVNNARYRLYMENDGLSLKLLLELYYRDHALIFSNISKISQPLKILKKSTYGVKSGLGRITDPLTNGKILWFLQNVSLFIEYYQYQPRKNTIPAGNYRTAYGAILTNKKPPFDVESTSVTLGFPGKSYLRINVDDFFLPDVNIRARMVESLFSTIQGLLYGYHLVSHISIFSTFGNINREEITILTPFILETDQIILKTYAATNFLNQNLSSRNITLNMNARAFSERELAMQLSIWKLICHSLEYNHVLSMGGGDADALGAFDYIINRELAQEE
ncbi:MAG: hypothetical protein LBR53_04245 [Deltaproteobacteria bacterium]|nr:hypothetical protein [Deltaproteobacteria bacterium]